MRVLVVDDAPAVRARLVELLDEVPGVETREAAELDAVVPRAQGVDVVVLDLHLYDRNGLDAVPALHRLKPRPLIIVMTNDATAQHRTQALSLGADHFLDKSREFDVVLELVRSRKSASS